MKKSSNQRAFFCSRQAKNSSLNSFEIFFVHDQAMRTCFFVIVASIEYGVVTDSLEMINDSWVDSSGNTRTPKIKQKIVLLPNKSLLIAIQNKQQITTQS